MELLDTVLHTIYMIVHTCKYMIVILDLAYSSPRSGSLPRPTETPCRPPGREQRYIPPTTGNSTQGGGPEAAG